MLHPVTEHIMAQKGVVARNMTRAVRNPTVVSELLEHETRVIVTKPAAARQRKLERLLDHAPVKTCPQCSTEAYDAAEAELVFGKRTVDGTVYWQSNCRRCRSRLAAARRKQKSA